MPGLSIAELHRIILRASLDGEHIVNIAKRLHLSYIHVAMVIKAGGEPAPPQAKRSGRPPKERPSDLAVKIPKRRGRPPKEKVPKAVVVKVPRGRPPKEKPPRPFKEPKSVAVKVPKRRGRPPKEKPPGWVENTPVSGKLVRLSGRLVLAIVAKLQNTGRSLGSIARELSVSHQWVCLVYKDARSSGVAIARRDPVRETQKVPNGRPNESQG